MAVFTDLSETECAQVARAFGLGALSSVIGIVDGDAETTFLYRTERGEFIVTLFETGAAPDELERAFRTMEALAQAGVPCPVTCRTANGSATLDVSGKLAAVVGFLPGSCAGDVTAEKCRSLGANAALLHRTLAKADEGFRSFLPIGAIHGALSRDNVFFIGEAVSGIINFRLRHDDVLIAELASLLVGWTAEKDGMLAGALSRALLTGYEQVRPLLASERRALPAFVMAATATSLAQMGRVAAVEENALRACLCARALLEGAL